MTITTTTNVFELIDSGIVKMSPVPNYFGEKCIPQAKENINALNKITKNEPFLLLVLMSKKPFSIKAREYIESQNLPIEGMAVVADSPQALSAGNISIQSLKLPYPVKIFMKVNQATDWLKGISVLN